jgi:hypothetical protein
MASNFIAVTWEFDIATDESLQQELGLSPEEANVNPEHYPEEAAELNKLCAQHWGVPLFVDLDLFFDNPHSMSNEEVTDALSDEYGWLVNDWHYVDSADDVNFDSLSL